MAFNLVEYIKRNLINGYKDGTWTESKVAQLCISYLDKGHLTVEDIAEVDAEVQAIKKAREEEQKALEETPVEETPVDPQE